MIEYGWYNPIYLRCTTLEGKVCKEMLLMAVEYAVESKNLKSTCTWTQTLYPEMGKEGKRLPSKVEIHRCEVKLASHYKDVSTSDILSFFSDPSWFEKMKNNFGLQWLHSPKLPYQIKKETE